MGRVRLTGGGYSKRPFSKSKRPRKPSPKREFFNIGGDLVILPHAAILNEKDPTGVFTGKTYNINLDSLNSKLPKRYKSSEELELICTLEIRINPGLEEDTENDQQESIYRVSRIHHVIDKTKAGKPPKDESNLNSSGNANNPNIKDEDSSFFDVNRKK